MKIWLKSVLFILRILAEKYIYKPFENISRRPMARLMMMIMKNDIDGSLNQGCRLFHAIGYTEKSVSTNSLGRRCRHEQVIIQIDIIL